jgi:GNAT superfamily N-acetyltransferase
MTIETKDLKPGMWRDVEKLFGPSGACGGCWCMSWRLEKGEKWDDVKGAEAKRRFKALVTSGKAHGVLAYVEGEPVGWSAYGPRLDFPKLARARTLACDDAEKVWSVPCFFVKAGFRGAGVARALLNATILALKKRGAELAEGYPVKPARSGQPIPAAFAWTGTSSLFRDAGFRVAGNPDGAKQRVRRRL